MSRGSLVFIIVASLLLWGVIGYGAHLAGQEVSALLEGVNAKIEQAVSR